MSPGHMLVRVYCNLLTRHVTNEPHVSLIVRDKETDAHGSHIRSVAPASVAVGHLS